jgi:hypothetical protein
MGDLREKAYRHRGRQAYRGREEGRVTERDEETRRRWRLQI